MKHDIFWYSGIWINIRQGSFGRKHYILHKLPWCVIALSEIASLGLGRSVIIQMAMANERSVCIFDVLNEQRALWEPLCAQ